MPDSVQQFYQQLAPDYHTIFADWRASVQRQAGILDNLIRGEMDDTARSVLDCSCGIGTQAIGLALHGYTVHATDLSPAAVERAAKEAESFGVSFTTGVADFRTLESQVAGTFDVVLSFDNSIAHLLTDEDLSLAIRNMRAKLRDGGLLMLSIRDYDRLIVDKPISTQPTRVNREEGRTLSFQVWDWAADGKSYTLNHFTVKQQGDGWQTSCQTTQLRALQRAELSAILQDAGFTNIRWLMPDDSGFYQPVVMARKYL
jgi:glycine/sarcosine N-methyltransferase